jgi:hypothetical protein
MVLFALMLPVLVAFMALSIGASVELNTRARLDEAALTASVAASSDACMSSPYAFDLYECKSGNPNYASAETSPGQLPLPSYADTLDPIITVGDPGGGFGTGGAGSVTVSPAGVTPCSSAFVSCSPSFSYTLQGDLNALSLTVNGHVTLNTASYIIYAQGTVKVTGAATIANNGNPATSGLNGSQGTGGAAVPSTPSLAGSGAGADGVTGGDQNGNNGSPGDIGGKGGAGDIGDGGVGTGGLGGAASSIAPTPYASGDKGGGGGGSGGASFLSGGTSGGGGSGGGIVEIQADTIKNLGTISAVGGNGGNGTSTYCSGGGGGGGGGDIYLVYSTSLTPGTRSVGGGSGGASGSYFSGCNPALTNGHVGVVGSVVTTNVGGGGGPVTTPAFHPINTSCSGSLNPHCVMVEHDLALQSADASVKQVLSADYPGFTVKTCPGETGVTAATSASACAAMVTSDNIIVYQDQVSYWYYADTDDAPGATAANSTAQNDTPTDDLKTGETLDKPSGGHADTTGIDGGTPPAPDPLTCPATNQLGRLITVQIWTHFNTPFGGVFGINNIGFTTTANTYGCGG